MVRGNENEKLTPSFLELLLFSSYAGNISPTQSAINNYLENYHCQEVTGDKKSLRTLLYSCKSLIQYPF